MTANRTEYRHMAASHMQRSRMYSTAGRRKRKSSRRRKHLACCKASRESQKRDSSVPAAGWVSTCCATRYYVWLAQIGNNKNRRGLEWISGPKGLQAEFCRMKKLEGGNICEDSSVEAGIERPPCRA